MKSTITTTCHALQKGKKSPKLELNNVRDVIMGPPRQGGY